MKMMFVLHIVHRNSPPNMSSHLMYTILPHTRENIISRIHPLNNLGKSYLVTSPLASS